MEKGDYLSAILRSSKTVFTYKDVAMLWQESDSPATRAKIAYYVKKGDLRRLRRGLYAKSGDYNKWELATRLYAPSYISFETVLAKEGIIFQYSDQICAASYTGRELTIAGQQYLYRQIKELILTNPLGVVHSNEISVASKERAFLDTLYINTDFQFDNLRSLDWEKVREMLPIYDNKRMVKVVKKYDSKYINS